MKTERRENGAVLEYARMVTFASTVLFAVRDTISHEDRAARKRSDPDDSRFCDCECGTRSWTQVLCGDQWLLNIRSVARKVKREGEAADLSFPLPLPGLPLKTSHFDSRLKRSNADTDSFSL
jgi:hypothetical protein